VLLDRSRHREAACNYAYRRSRPNSGRSGSLQKRRAPRAKHNQRFDRPALVTEVSVNIKFYVQRVGLNLCKSSLGSAYRARIQRLEHGAMHPDRPVVSPRSTLARCCLRTLDQRKCGALSATTNTDPRLQATQPGCCTRTRSLAHERLWQGPKKRSTFVMLKQAFC
jgi:hypothetical protein